MTDWYENPEIHAEDYEELMALMAEEAEGDCASLIMDDNGTEKILDDMIIMAQYGGWTLINWEE